MTEKEKQLVQLVAAEVIRVMRQRNMTSQQGSRAEVHPPIGTCTGDYSKFVELTQPQQVAQVQHDAIALAGIVTAAQLQEAMDGAADGVAVLAHDARLTPLANDLARQHPEKIRRASATSTASQPPATGWFYWIDGQCPVATQTVQQRSSILRPLTASRGGAALQQVVRELASAVKARTIAGGILFVPNAARAMCYANRCASLRAVVGTCGEAVEQGVAELGANVLVIEYPHHGPRSMEAMVDRMLQQSPNVPAAVQRDLADLHRC